MSPNSHLPSSTEETPVNDQHGSQQYGRLVPSNAWGMRITDSFTHSAHRPVQVTIPHTVTLVLDQQRTELDLPAHLQFQLTSKGLSDIGKTSMIEETPDQAVKRINTILAETSKNFFSSLCPEDFSPKDDKLKTEGPFTVPDSLQKLWTFKTGDRSDLVIESLRPKGLPESSWQKTGSGDLTTDHVCTLSPANCRIEVECEKSNKAEQLVLVVPSAIGACNSHVRYLPSDKHQALSHSIRERVLRNPSPELRSVYEYSSVPESLKPDIQAMQLSHLEGLTCSDLLPSGQSQDKDFIKVALPDSEYKPQVRIPYVLSSAGMTWGQDSERWNSQRKTLLPQLKTDMESSLLPLKPSHMKTQTWTLDTVSDAVAVAAQNLDDQLKEVHAGNADNFFSLELGSQSKFLDCSCLGPSWDLLDDNWGVNARECGPDEATHIITELELSGPHGQVYKTGRPQGLMTAIPGLGTALEKGWEKILHDV